MNEMPQPRAELSEFHEALAAENLGPLWEVMRALAPREPRSSAVPYCWEYALLRRYVMEAGSLITAEEAERRVLILENPGLKGQSQATTSLYAGIQLILPGEIAPSHRHSANALRLILEGEGGTTSVDGEQARLAPGDFLITPSWSFHDHGNIGPGPVIWLDGLDVPVVNLLNAGFAEDYPTGAQPLARPEGDALARYGSGLTPVNYVRRRVASPVFHYPYARTRAALASLRHGECDPYEGVKLQFTDPTTGRSPLPTMAAYMQWLPAGFRGRALRSTDGGVYAVVEGQGRVYVGDRDWTVGPHDVFVVPGWSPRRFEAIDADLILFSFSDRPLQDSLGLWREFREITATTRVGAAP